MVKLESLEIVRFDVQDFQLDQLTEVHVHHDRTTLMTLYPVQKPSHRVHTSIPTVSQHRKWCRNARWQTVTNFEGNVYVGYMYVAGPYPSHHIVLDGPISPISK